MLFGSYTHVLDSKKRVIIPARLREAIGEQTEGLVFYITPGQDKCLYIFPEEIFNKLTEDVGFGLLVSGKKREAFRKFFSNVARRVCDKQGRVQIPDELIEFAGLKGEVVFVGFKDRIEVWDAGFFKELGQSSLQDFGEIAEKLIGDD
jgi:MraZ protein